ncbi:OSBL6-like protein [Mya arenaria]|uniref:OSBL6-like protein n=1 Tax=Mya arenaria TaxID=6604 RepID=A0ABY7ERV7_MYAAR|nr:OSBL6-like protein [Mya arenaria]
MLGAEDVSYLIEVDLLVFVSEFYEYTTLTLLILQSCHKAIGTSMRWKTPDTLGSREGHWDINEIENSGNAREPGGSFIHNAHRADPVLSISHWNINEMENSGNARGPGGGIRLDGDLEEKSPKHQTSHYFESSRKSRSQRSRRVEWEIVEGLRDGQKCERLPEKYQGYLSKRKRWPMKGWHKRYFLLEKGILYYGKSPSDIQKGKYHGVIDTGLSRQVFDDWLNKLREHRLYRQHEIAYGTKESPRLTELNATSPVEDLNNMNANLNLAEKARDSSLHRELSRHPSLKGQDRVATWLLDTQGFEQCNKAQAQNLLYQLNKDLESIRELPLNTENDLFDCENNDKKKNRSFAGRITGKKKDHKRNASLQETESIPRVHTQPSISLPPTPQISSSNAPPTFKISKDQLRSSSSNPNLHVDDKPRPTSAPLTMGLSPEHQSRVNEIKLREGFMHKADQVHETLRTLFHSMSTERDRLRQTVDMNKVTTVTGSSSMNAMKQTLADMAGLSQSFSTESCSMSEYYDAVEENNLESMSDSSSERSDEEISSDISDDNETEMSITHSGRRSKLPVPKPDKGDVSLWNLLFRNIGKDLTKISMPRLCEELEYSELLEKANEYADPYERMMYIAAFAVSSYASSCYRVGHKPFNPLLGETYENIREDKGWKFVSHHPPISACYCESKIFQLWQDVQIKSKFWGKSMEIQPIGIASHYYQSDKRHEVYGVIENGEGMMPEDYEMYYGFSRFAMELNEILPDEKPHLPSTDSRFRPDQRLLEEGRIPEAEKEKSRVETLQRDSRKKREAKKQEYKPAWFRKNNANGKDVFVYDHKYWETRKDPDFSKTQLHKLW